MFKSKGSKIVLALVGCLLCTEVLAATIFSVAPTDRSKIYLGMVFGGNVGSIQLSGDANTTLALMFERFNYIILTIGALVLSYIGVASTINTAREGEAMGKKMSAWVPIRAFLGTLLMVPGPTSGYSVVQITVVWIVLNGIGAANSIWSVILNQLSRNIAVVANTSATMTTGADTGNPAMNNALEQLTQNVLMASTCMHTLNGMSELSQTTGSPMQQYGPVKVYVYQSSTTPTITSTDGNGNPTGLSLSATVYVGLNTPSPSALSALCGSFDVKSTLKQSTNPNDTFNNATISQRLAIKIAALQSMFSTVDSAAALIAGATITNGPTGGIDSRFYTAPNPGYVLLAEQTYISQTIQLLQGIQVAPSGTNAEAWEQGIQNNNNAPIDLGNTSAITKAEFQGWIHAGSYYYALVQASNPQPNPDYQLVPTSNGNVPMGIPTPFDANTNMPTGGTWPSINGNGNIALYGFITGQPPYYESTKMNAYLNAMNAYYNVDINNSTISTSAISMGTAQSTGNAFIDSIVNTVMRGLQNAILGGFERMVSGNGQDPLASLHKFGWGLMLSGEVMGIYFMILSMAISTALSSGSCLSPFAWSTQTLLLQFMPLVFGLCAMLWTGGATLNIYLPMVPYLIFSMAAFGWMVAVIEAVVGAPIVALALAHPSGEELGKIGQSLLLLANVFLRPMLMLFGFVLGAGLLRAGITFINFGFLPAINASTSPTLFSVIAVLMMYIFTIMAIVNKSFSLVYLLPNQIMRWIGGPTETSDPSDMFKEAKGGFDTGAKVGQGALNEGLNQGKAGMSDALKDAKKADAARQKAPMPRPAGQSGPLTEKGNWKDGQ